MDHMVLPPADRLTSVVLESFRSAGLLHEDGTLRAREAERRVDIKRNTLARRLQSGDFTIPELEKVAAAVGTSAEELMARAKGAA